MNFPRVYADLQNADPQGRVRLNCQGTIEDLSRQKIILLDGLQLCLYCEELEVDGVASYSTDEGVWVAKIDWNAIHDRGAPVPDSEHSASRRHSA